MRGRFQVKRYKLKSRTTDYLHVDGLGDLSLGCYDYNAALTRDFIYVEDSIQATVGSTYGFKYYKVSEHLDVWQSTLADIIQKNNYYTSFKLPENISPFTLGCINGDGSDLRLYSTILSGCYIQFSYCNKIQIHLMNTDQKFIRPWLQRRFII